MVNKQPMVDELLARSGYKPLSRTWAKAEIFLGLASAGAGVLFADIIHPGLDLLPGAVVALGRLMLFVFGGYLALAGHRSHLYQSQNELAAFLLQELGGHREEALNPEKLRREYGNVP